jgi:N utilization substance protein A
MAFDELVKALEDALLSAYKETPGSVRYAKVEIDRNTGDFIVWGLKIPPELEQQLLIDATEEQRPTVDPETGEMREAPGPEIDLEKLKEYEDQIEFEDATPPGFGQIAAQTAKRVMLQRIREAERAVIFEVEHDVKDDDSEGDAKDDEGGGSAGVREPRRPMPSGSGSEVAVEPEAEPDR